MIPLFIGWERKFLAFFWSDSLQHLTSTSPPTVPPEKSVILLPRGIILYRVQRGSLLVTLCESLVAFFYLGPGPANLNISDRFQ